MGRLFLLLQKGLSKGTQSLCANTDPRHIQTFNRKAGRFGPPFD